MSHNLVCWKCGASLAQLSLPLRRLDECAKCHAELHVCKLCVDYDTRVAKHCREPTADEVNDKTKALLDLLSGKGSEEDRWKDIETLYGITSRALYRVVESELHTMETLITQVAASAKALNASAQLSKRSSATSS